jgi:hypothetical protein
VTLADKLLPWATLLPALSFGCLIVGVCARGRLPFLLVVVGLLAPLGVVGYGILDVNSREHGRDLDYWLVASVVWASAVAVLLISAILSKRGGSRPVLSLAGLILSVIPFVPIVLFILLVSLSGGME